MISKIQSHHHQKMAYVYLRQSTMGQVRHHQESTARQYALKDRALNLGWQSDQIRVLDQASRALSAIFVPVFCLSRFHLPAFLCSTCITPLLRSYEGSVTFRARFFGPSAGHERRSFPES
jgi:hypothetical protein